MSNEEIANIVKESMQIGTIRTLAELGLYPDQLSEKQAFKIYGKKNIIEWRSRGWITAYPSWNSERSKYYYKRAECEVAKHMISIQNSIPINKIFN